MTREILRSEPTVKQHRKNGAAHSAESAIPHRSRRYAGWPSAIWLFSIAFVAMLPALLAILFFAMHTWQSPRCWNAANTIKFAVLELRNNRKSYMALSDAILIKIAILFFSVRSSFSLHNENSQLLATGSVSYYPFLSHKHFPPLFLNTGTI